MVNGVIVIDFKGKIVEGVEVEIIVLIVDDSYIGFEDILFEVIFEDDDLIVINKFVGMVVYLVSGMFSGILVNVFLYYCGDILLGVGGEKCSGIVYWIDKEIFGFLVVVKLDCVYYGFVK